MSYRTIAMNTAHGIAVSTMPKYRKPNKPTLTRWRAANSAFSAQGEAVMERWLEYDLVALAMLVFGIAAVEFLALSF